MERRPSRVSFSGTGDYKYSRMSLNYPIALLKGTLGNLRPIFALMCKHAYSTPENREAIRATDTEINELLAELKGEWGKASLEYAQKWRAGNTRKIKSANKALTESVQKTKREYERMKKVRTAFDEAMEKYNVKRFL